MPENALGVDGSVLNALLELVARQRRLEELRTRAESRRDSVTSAVYDRVIADYQSRLDALCAEAAPLKGRARAEYQKLKALEDRLRQKLDVARLDKEELEFRRDLGEIEEPDFSRRSEAPAAVLQQCQSELDALEVQAARFREAVGPDGPAEDAPESSGDSGAVTMMSVPEGFATPAHLRQGYGGDAFASAADVPEEPDSGRTVRLPEGRLVLDEDGTLTEFQLSASSHIGRTLGNQVQLVCAGVSRRHALISLGPDQNYFIKDLRSQNGTFVNGEQVTEACLADGDHIKIGEANLTFQLVPSN